MNQIGEGSFGKVFVFPYKNKSYVIKEIYKSQKFKFFGKYFN